MAGDGEERPSRKRPSGPDLNRCFDWLDAHKRPILNGLYVTAAAGALAAALSLRSVR